MDATKYDATTFNAAADNVKNTVKSDAAAGYAIDTGNPDVAETDTTEPNAVAVNTAESDVAATIKFNAAPVNVLRYRPNLMLR